MNIGLELILKLSYTLIVLIIVVSTVLLAIALWIFFALIEGLTLWPLYALALVTVIICDAVAIYLMWLVFKSIKDIIKKEYHV